MYHVAQIALIVLVLAAGVAHLVASTTSMAVTSPNATSSWAEHLTVADDALAAGDVSAAVSAWYDAYGAALATRQWQPMLRVGDAFLTIGEASGARDGARANARQAYLVALMRAQRERSVDGALSVADSFAALGDRGVAIACVQVARSLAEARQDRLAIERVREFTTTRLPERS